MLEKVKPDPVQQELIRYSLEAAVDEMSITIVQASYSNTLRDVLDFSTALLTPDGEMIAQGLSLPLHLGAFPSAFARVMERFSDDVGEGDVYVLNDPFYGGMHLPDVFMFRPVFFEGEILGYAAVVGHQADIGGRVAGGNACDSKEIFQEGIRIPPLRAIHADVDNATFWDLIKINVRLPDSVIGDLRAQIAGLKVGEREMLSLARKVGREKLRHAMDFLLDSTEKQVRNEIHGWEDGVYSYTDYIDNDGVDISKSLPISVNISVKGSDLFVDFDGSAEQVSSSINSSLASTISAVALAIRAVLPNTIANNSGLFRLIHVRADEGLIVNPRSPAAVAGRALTCFRIVDAVLGALASALPHRVFAAGDGGVSIITMSGARSDGSRFVLMDSVGSCWGGRPWADGVDAITPISLNISNIPTEVIEREYPIRVEAHRLVPDSGGAGQYRGGLAQEKLYQFLVDDVDVQLRSDRQDIRPYGLAGGEAGEAARSIITQAGNNRVMPCKFSTVLNRGDLLVHRTAGGGGWGHPSDRAPASIADDLQQGKVTAHCPRGSVDTKPDFPAEVSQSN